MKRAYTLVLFILFIGLLEGCTGTMLKKGTEMQASETAGIECVSNEGAIFGFDYVTPGVVDENGNCVVLQDTASRIIHDKATYALLTGRVLERDAKDYTIRIADQDRDGRVDNYDLIDRSGNIILGYFRDLETRNVYCKCTLAGRVADGMDARLESCEFLDRLNGVLDSPREHGFKVLSD